MDALEILRAFGEDGVLCEEVLSNLSSGMFDEWDCSLDQAIVNGLTGPDELALAAQAGAGKLAYEREQAKKRS